MSNPGCNVVTDSTSSSDPSKTFVHIITRSLHGNSEIWIFVIMASATSYSFGSLTSEIVLATGRQNPYLLTCLLYLSILGLALPWIDSLRLVTVGILPPHSRPYRLLLRVGTGADGVQVGVFFVSTGFLGGFLSLPFCVMSNNLCLGVLARWHYKVQYS